jgi:hypothetical protein
MRVLMVCVVVICVIVAVLLAFLVCMLLSVSAFCFLGRLARLVGMLVRMILLGMLRRLLAVHGGPHVEHRLSPIGLVFQHQGGPVLGDLSRVHRRLAAPRQRHEARD